MEGKKETGGDCDAEEGEVLKSLSYLNKYNHHIIKKLNHDED